MKLKLTGDWILVEPVMRKRITVAGIHMPEGMQQNEPHYGRVLEVGPGKIIEAPQIVKVPQEDGTTLTFLEANRLPMSVKPGDMIFYSVLHPYPILYHGKGHFIIHEYEVFAVVDDEEEGQKLRETLIADTEKHESDAECPEHGKKCSPWYAESDGKKGIYCPTAHNFYPEAELNA